MKKPIIALLLSFVSLVVCAQITWHPISVPTQAQLNCISFGTSQVGFVGGNDSLFLKTTDGGKTWNRQALNLAFTTNMRDVIALQFLDAQNGYILVGPYGGLYSTSDGGLTWISEQPNQTNMCFKSSLYFRDAQNGFVGGSMCFQGATIGNKVNGLWDTVKVVGGWDASQQIQAFDFRNNLLGLAVGTQSTIFRTTDGGTTWDSVYASLDTLNLTDVAFLNDTLVYASYANVGLEGALVSYDGGLTWQRDFGLATFAYPGFDAALNVAGRPYLGGRVSWGNGGIIFNLTPSWWNYSLVPQRIHGLALHSDSTVFAVGDSGYVAVNRLPASIGIAENELVKVEVYPNPASGLLFVNAPLNFIGATFQVIDTKGTTYLVGNLSSERTELPIQNLPSGVYFITFNNEQLQPVKLVVD